MLDAEKGGHFKLAPILNEAKHKQLYLPDTNMLLTRFLADGAFAEVSDFMPVAELGIRISSFGGLRPSGGKLISG